MKKSPKNVVHFKEIMHQFPHVLPKIPRLLRGLKQVYTQKQETPMGLGLIFEKIAKQHPRYNALKFGDQTTTYQHLNQHANQIAHLLIAYGFKKGDVLSLVMENRPEFFAVMLATAKVGVICALIDPTKITTKTLLSTEPKGLIVSDQYHQKIDALKLNFEHYFWVASLEQNKQENAPSGYRNLIYSAQEYPTFNPPTTAHIYAQDGLFYIYTSGTTGQPKAALYTHGRWILAYNTYGQTLGLVNKDILYVPLPLHHATASIVCWSSVLAGQGTFSFNTHFSAQTFWQDAQDAVAIGYSGDVCRQLLEQPVQPNQHQVKKMIGYGLRTYYWRTFKHRFNIKEVFELYASNESNIGFNNLFNFDNTVGFSPLPFAVVKYDIDSQKPIRDKNGYCTEVKKGDVGLLLSKITSRTPFDGYGKHDINDDAVLHHVFNEHDAYYNTGDLMRRLGYRHVQFIDRLSDTFHWQNQRISTHEVEDVMCTCPSIKEASIYGVKIPNYEGKACMATVILNPISPIFDCKNIYAEFKKALPTHAIPLFLRIQLTLPVSSAFKYSKKELQKQGFDIHHCDDLLLVQLPHQDTYHPLNHKIYEHIMQKKPYF